VHISTGSTGKQDESHARQWSYNTAEDSSVLPVFDGSIYVYSTACVYDDDN
jgi:hypothetical protein